MAEADEMIAKGKTRFKNADQLMADLEKAGGQ
jgi:hypothetical protein